MRNLDKFSRLYSGRVAKLEDGDIFRANVPVVRTAAGSGQDAVLALVSSIIGRDGSLTTSDLAKAGGVSVRTGQRWVRALLESGRLKPSDGDTKRYVLVGEESDAEAT